MRKNLNRHWGAVITGPVLAFLLIAFWYFNQSYLAEARNVVVLLLENPILTFGLIILGSFISAFIFGEFSFKTPGTYEPLVFALLGGLIMGSGAVMAAMSVHSIVLFNLVGIFNLTAFMITKGWIYAIFMALGGFVGSKLFVNIMLRTSHLKKDFFLPCALREKNIQRIIFFLSLGLFIFFLLAILLFSRLGFTGKISFSVAALFLVVLGAVFERGTICMSSMLKEWFISRTSYVWRSVLAVIMWLALFYQLGLRLTLYKPITLERYISNVGLLALGSFLMGAGFIFADGCFIGSLWKAGQGNIINVAGIFGMLTGIGVFQIGIRSYLVTPENNFGSGLIPNYLNCFVSPLWFLVILWVLGFVFLVFFKHKRYNY